MIITPKRKIKEEERMRLELKLGCLEKSIKELQEKAWMFRKEFGRYWVLTFILFFNPWTSNKNFSEPWDFYKWLNDKHLRELRKKH